ncbi:hypothetical protein ONZ43_g4730 [Nemania bipapillata]|uniref:Uncharacterized protein n=1 Tax=Nemania bipapillata TaxID=110536 RepID=A0ACC2IJ37_9PEZI|nr:hypothetical protein ONZ43_g4730 [Nemania bipapillata]
MTVTPLRNDRLWHPSRGISFSPSPAPLASAAQGSRNMARVSAGVSYQHHNITTAASVGTQREEEAWATAVVQQATLPSPSLQEPAEHAGGHPLVQVTVEMEEEGAAVVAAEEPERKMTNKPPPPVFEYKMVDDLFYAAKKSPPGSPESFWSYTLYRSMTEEGSPQRVKVHYCRSKHTMERVCKQYFMNEKILGFDLEWMSDATRFHGLKRNVSLIQLASPSRIGLFHVALFANSEDMVGPSFRSLMEDPEVTKLGVSIKGDTTRLRNFLDIHSQGLIELSNLYKLVKYSKSREYDKINRRLVPLATQVEEYLHLPLFKGQDVRSSDWSKPLTIDQVLCKFHPMYVIGIGALTTCQIRDLMLTPEYNSTQH